MFKEYAIKLMLFLVLLSVSSGLVLLLNLGNIRFINEAEVTFDSKEDYELTELASSARIQINGTPNGVFKSIMEVDGVEYYFFALKEYGFDFILITNEESNSKSDFSCVNISETEDDLLDTLIEKFNTPISLEGLEDDTSDPLGEDVKQTLTQNTIGNFGDESKLLDCTESFRRSVFEVQFLIAAEAVILLICLMFLFRETFLNFYEDVHDGVPGHND